MAVPPPSIPRIWRPYTQMKGAREPLRVASARRAVLRLADGREIIDAISSWWVITHGHRTPEIMEAIAEQTRSLDHVIFAEFTHAPAEALVELLVPLLPEGLDKVFFSDNGSTAVEVALKMALQACKQRGEPRRRRFLAFSAGYHGDTAGAMSVSARGPFTAPYGDLLFPVLRADQGRRTGDPLESWVAGFRTQVERHGEELAAVILEPLIQGAGGMVMWPETAVREIVTTCQARGILVIFDEVMTGFGRTGDLFAHTRLGLRPDLLCLSKGLTGGTLPLAVTVATDEVYQAFYSDDRSRMLFHGHSFTANPIACAAAAANLRLIAQPGVQRDWHRIGTIHHQRLQSLPHQHLLRDRRACGVVAAIEFDTEGGYLDGLGPALHHLALDSGVLLRPLGNILYVLPPYSITDEQLHRTWDVMDAAMNLVREMTGRERA